VSPKRDGIRRKKCGLFREVDATPLKNINGFELIEAVTAKSQSEKTV